VAYIAANRLAEARELEPTAHALTHSLARPDDEGVEVGPAEAGRGEADRVPAGGEEH
jgi:hypothetical protein